jgi:uncharacterized protein YegJ (DUF2314 family)
LDFTPSGGHKDKREIYQEERKRWERIFAVMNRKAMMRVIFKKNSTYHEPGEDFYPI